ncbi:MAG TPA: phosphotransferase family protein [Acidimicrobiia bacterium]|nr:phosphotransferase family protein [Acidimicrobiia bacterium]
MAVRAPDGELLVRALGRTFPSPVTVDALRRLSGGASRETWAFDATDAAGVGHPLVLRRDPGSTLGATDRATEFELLAATAGAGVPVPTTRLLLAPDDGLGTGFVMDRVEGETIPRRILRDEAFASARPRLAAQCGEILARIHAVPVASLPPLAPQPASRQLDDHTALLDVFGEPHPAFELGLRWLREHLPPERPELGLVHGDFRNGNLIVGPDGVRAVLDWELAHLGDPVEDLGWLCVKSWRFGVADRVVGGFGDLDDLLDAYARAGGDAPTRDALQFWVVLGTLKWGLICMAQAFTHLHGVVRSVELAMLGRRVAEMEWDLLELLDGRW